MLGSFDRWLFDEYRLDVRSLALFRILFAGYLLLAELPSDLWIRELPPVAFSPPISAAALFLHYPPEWVVFALNAALLLCTCTLAIGWRTVWSSCGVAIGFLALRTLAYADGKIDHDIFFALTSLVLAGSGWGAAFSLDAARIRASAPDPRRNQQWLLAVLGLLIGLAVLTAGLAKVHGGWLHASTLATRANLISNYYVTARSKPAALWALLHLPAWIWKAMDLSTVAWELSFLFTIPRMKLFRAGCAVGALFHFGVWITFDIRFAANLLAYGAFVDWAALAPRATAALEKWLAKISPLLKAILCAAPFAVAASSLFAFAATPSDKLSLHLPEFLLVAGLAFGLAWLAHLATRGASPRSSNQVS